MIRCQRWSKTIFVTMIYNQESLYMYIYIYIYKQTNKEKEGKSCILDKDYKLMEDCLLFVCQKVYFYFIFYIPFFKARLIKARY